MKNIYILSFLSIFVLVGCMEDRLTNSQIKTSSVASSESEIKVTSWFVPSPKENSTIEDLTRKNFYVIFDGSGSMGGSGCADGSTKEVVAKNALKKFAKSINPNYNLGLLVFDGAGVTERVTLATGNRDLFVQKVFESDTNSGTPLKTAMNRGIAKLKQQAGNQLGYGEYHLVVITDGEAGVGEDPTSVVDEAVGNTPIEIHTMGFCIGENHALNQPNKTFYVSANSAEELMKGLSEVSSETSSFEDIATNTFSK